MLHITRDCPFSFCAKSVVSVTARRVGVEGALAVSNAIAARFPQCHAGDSNLVVLNISQSVVHRLPLQTRDHLN